MVPDGLKLERSLLDAAFGQSRGGLELSPVAVFQVVHLSVHNLTLQAAVTLLHGTRVCTAAPSGCYRSTVSRKNSIDLGL